MVDNKQKLIITNKNTSTIITTNTTEITTAKPFPLFQWQYLLKEWKNILGTEYELTIYSFAEKFQYLFGLCYDCKEIHYATLIHQVSLRHNVGASMVWDSICWYYINVKYCNISLDSDEEFILGLRKYTESV